MARKTGKIQPKKAIYVFWEGESEEAYLKFLRKNFSDHVSLKIHREGGTFSKARQCYQNDRQFHNNVSELDEIWFFFDREIDNSERWENNMNCLKRIIDSRGKKNPIRIRLLMTSCCVEYWFLLHYEDVAPSMRTPADKERILRKLQTYVKAYRKGDNKSTTSIAQNYALAIEHGEKVLNRLKSRGMPNRTPEDTLACDEWLFKSDYTFTTVHEAVATLLL